VSLFIRPGDAYTILVIQGALIIGDIFAVVIVYYLDTGWDTLRSIVGGRRAEDKVNGSS
jgi:hypothetical protein